MNRQSRSTAGTAFRQVFIALGATLLASPALSATHIATTASARDFLAGEAMSTAVTSDGRLQLAAPLGPKLWPEDAGDAVVFAAAADGVGTIYVATGGGSGRLFAISPAGKATLLFTAAEPNLTSVIVAPDGAVLCGSSPNGKVYRIDPKVKPGSPSASSEWADPKEAAIWALAAGPDSTLYVGTGNKGRIWRRTPAGKVELFTALEDVHVRSLAVGKDGTVYAGTSDRGLLVAISPTGVARTLHDFLRPEVVGIVVKGDGTVFAAATAAEPPPLSLPQAAPAVPRPAPAATPAAPSAGPREEVPKGTVSISTSPARLAPAPIAKEREGNAEIVVVSPDGFVEPAWGFHDETLYSLLLDAKGDRLLIGTGPKGRVYSWKDRHLRLEAQTEQKQVVAALPLAGGLVAVTMNSPGVFLPGGKLTVGSFLSAVRDAGRLATFGRLRHESRVPVGAGLAFSMRCGNSVKPDGTWSPWTPVAADGAAPKLPAARYFQWRAELKAGPKGESPSVEKVEFSYTDRNARPIVENVNVLEPGAVFYRAGASPTAVLSVTNPDESGIYAGLETPSDRGPEGMPAKKLYRKGYRTVTWKGMDPNGDSLRYELEARREGTPVWFPVKRELEESYYSFDSTALPDGHYRFRVTASDHVSNPEGQALTASEEGLLAVIDNTPPVLKLESKRVRGAELEVSILATDALSAIAKGEAAVNADRWRLLSPEDGAADSPTERFVLHVPKPGSPAVVSIRVVDTAGNVAALAVEYPKDFE